MDRGRGVGNMDDLSVTSGVSVSAAREIDSRLFRDFVQWLDRGEGTTRTYITNLRQFAAWLRYTACTRPTRQDVIAYREWLLKEHPAIRLNEACPNGWSNRVDRHGRLVMVRCRPATAAQYIRSVKQFFQWTAANGLYPNIADHVTIPKVSANDFRKDALTPEQVLTVEDSILKQAEERTSAASEKKKDTAGRIQRSTEQGKRLFAMYLLAVNAGLRTCELSRANVQDLEIKDGQAWLYVWGKGHSEADQKKPIASEVAQALQDYLSSRADFPTRDSPLFVSTGNRSGGKRIAPTTISTMLKRALQAAGFDSVRLTAHSLRHSAGTAAMEATDDNIYLTQTYLRHSDPRITEKYTHRQQDQMQAVIAQRIYDLYHGNV